MYLLLLIKVGGVLKMNSSFLWNKIFFLQTLFSRVEIGRNMTGKNENDHNGRQPLWKITSKIPIILCIGLKM
jgi:hypothetical protein